jgi:uncharacterized protein (UPF0332 family)
MIKQERIREANDSVRHYVTDGLLRTNDDGIKKFVLFFMEQAEKSLRTADFIYKLSTNDNTKQSLRAEKDFESYIWVIVTSYYSMFYAALALLAREGIKVGRQIVHKVTADALISFFISNRRLAKMFENYEEARDATLDLIGREELMKRLEKRADELIIAYEQEMKKRSKFQYDIGEMARRGYAETSLTRAREFFAEVRKILSE